MEKNQLSLKLAKLFLLAVLILNSSCTFFMASAGAVVGSGFYRFMEDDLMETLNVPIEEGWLASQKALIELGFQDLREERDKEERVLIARNAEDKRIMIFLEKQTEEVTSFRINTGAAGEEDLAVFIFDHIRKQLKILSLRISEKEV